MWMVMLPCLLEAAGADYLSVYVVPHSHCDTGWLKTVDGYYEDQVQHILTTVTDALAADPNRRFIWSEIKWISLWWPKQTEGTKEKFRAVVRSGQLEFVGGGWSQNDEVTPTYLDILENVQTGHDYLRDIGIADNCPQRGRCVRFGWQIDMFAGFSGATPSLWTLAGYDGMFSRWEGTAKQRGSFVHDRAFEFVWQASAALPASRSQIWSHIINGNYGDLASLTCGQNDTGHTWIKPFVPCTTETIGLQFQWPGGKPVTSTNVQQYAEMFAAFVRKRHVYRGAQLAVWGTDYAFTDAAAMFDSMDRVLAEINTHPAKYNMSVQYTTLAQYADVVHTSGQRFPTKTYPLDFEQGWPHAWNLTLADNYTVQYQTGAPTSRAALKQLARSTAAKYRVAASSVASALADGTLTPTTAKKKATALQPVRDILGVMQHHDAMTGTMSAAGSLPWGPTVDWACRVGDAKICPPCTEKKCMVLEDFTASLDSAAETTASVLAQSLSARSNVSAIAVRMFEGTAHNTSAFPTVLVTNPLATVRHVLITVLLPPELRPTSRATRRLPVVKNSDSKVLPAQLDPAGDKISWIARLGPLGWHTYKLAQSKEIDDTGSTVWPKLQLPVGPGNFSNSAISVHFDEVGMVDAVYAQGHRIALEYDYMEYKTASGGPYCLVETEPARLLSAGNVSHIEHLIGPLFSEIRVSRQWGADGFEANSMLRTITRITRGTSTDAVLLLEHTIPTIPLNTELIHRVKTDLDTDGLYKDESGFELFPAPASAEQHLPISGRYHAAVLAAAVRDRYSTAPRQLSLLTQHTKGIASLAPGHLEYMLVRRINGTDDQGPWPLNETTPLSISVGLHTGVAAEVESQRLNYAHSLENPPVILNVKSSVPMHSSGSAPSQLPPGLHLLSLSVAPPSLGTPPGSVVMRIQNTRSYGPPISVNAARLLHGRHNCTEYTATLQQKLIGANRLQWPLESGGTSSNNDYFEDASDCAIKLSPLDIRTFVLNPFENSGSKETPLF